MLATLDLLVMLGTSYADSRRLEAALLVQDTLAWESTVILDFGVLSVRTR